MHALAMFTRLHTCTGFAISDKSNDVDSALTVGFGIAVAVAVAVLVAVFAAWVLIRKRTKKFSDAELQYSAVQRTDNIFAAAVEQSF